MSAEHRYAPRHRLARLRQRLVGGESRQTRPSSPGAVERMLERRRRPPF